MEYRVKCPRNVRCPKQDGTLWKSKYQFVLMDEKNKKMLSPLCKMCDGTMGDRQEKRQK